MRPFLFTILAASLLQACSGSESINRDSSRQEQEDQIFQNGSKGIQAEESTIIPRESKVRESEDKTYNELQKSDDEDDYPIQ